MTRKKQLITKTSIKKILSDCAFDPHRSLFKVAAENSDAAYCMTRAQEYIQEGKLTLDRSALIQSIRSLVLAISFLEAEGESNGAKESQVP